MKITWVTIFSLLPLYCITDGEAANIFFQHEERRVFIPRWYPVGAPLYQASATSDDPNVKIRYCLRKNPHKIFAIDRNTGVVQLRNTQKMKPSTAKSLQILACPGSECKKSQCKSMWPRIVLMADSLDCKNSTHLCLLPPRTYHVLENRKDVNLGSVVFLPSRHLCHQVAVNYTTDDPTYQVHNNELIVKRPFDREANDSMAFSLNCVLNNQVSRTQKFRIQVEDEDDNPPMLIPKTQKELGAIELRPQHYRIDIVPESDVYDGGLPFQPTKLKSLVVKDNDLVPTNHYSTTLLDNNRGYFSLQEPRLVDGNGFTFAGLVLYTTTAIRRRSLFNQSIVIKVKDESYVLKDGKQELSLEIHFNAPNTSIPEVTFPHEHIAYLPMHAPQYTRVYQPFDKVSAYSLRNIFFEIQSKEPTPFHVTPHEGIVFLENVEMWTNRSYGNRFEFRLFVGLPKEKFHYIQIKVLLEEQSEHFQYDCDNINMICAEHDNQEECEASCSDGTLQETCQWRQGPGGEQLTSNYSTCSTNLKFCPNGYCDELEDNVWSLCPQDCALDRVTYPDRYDKGDEGKGIKRAAGLCYCKSLTHQCICDVDNTTDIDQYVYDRISENRTETEKQYSLPVEHSATDTLLRVALVICGGVLVLMICCAICVVWRLKKVSKPGSYRNPLRDRLADYAQPRRVADTSTGIDPSDPMLQQIFPEDRKWEFPRTRLILEQTLGEGEFGRVVRAKAFGINGIQGFSTVAVKMLKSGAASQDNQDIITELNLLKEVDHPNVIKLMGACTTKGGPLLIIMEYCSHGSLRCFLRRCRRAEENKVGYEIPEREVTQRDILSFAWQISKGMAYLANLKFVHRDLAARNVLLAEGQRCKISDFGLTRDVYEADTYTKRSKGRVPVKWMALESLVDNIYSSKSDVWSFGIVLYECVTLGQSPYPGVTPERLFTLLQDGYRMDKPTQCPEDIYLIMRQCWVTNPDSRPTFEELSRKLEVMLESQVDYTDMAPPTVTNPQYFEDEGGTGNSGFTDGSGGSEANTTATTLNSGGTVYGPSYDTPRREPLCARDLPDSFVPMTVRIVKSNTSNTPTVSSGICEDSLDENSRLLQQDLSGSVVYSAICPPSTTSGYEIPHVHGSISSDQSSGVFSEITI